MENFGRNEDNLDNDIDAEGAQNVQITIYPTEAQVREGRDVTFDCRARTADNTVYPPVRYIFILFFHTFSGGPVLVVLFPPMLMTLLVG